MNHQKLHCYNVLIDVAKKMPGRIRHDPPSPKIGSLPSKTLNFNPGLNLAIYNLAIADVLFWELTDILSWE